MSNALYVNAVAAKKALIEAERAAERAKETLGEAEASLRLRTVASRYPMTVTTADGFCTIVAALPSQYEMRHATFEYIFSKGLGD